METIGTHIFAKEMFLIPLNSLYCREKDFEFLSFHEASGDHG